jgi:hypothetical protein
VSAVYIDSSPILASFRFYETTLGPGLTGWKVYTNWLSEDLSTWHGLLHDDLMQIVELKLSDCGIQGPATYSQLGMKSHLVHSSATTFVQGAGS